MAARDAAGENRPRAEKGGRPTSPSVAEGDRARPGEHQVPAGWPGREAPGLVGPPLPSSAGSWGTGCRASCRRPAETR